MCDMQYNKKYMSRPGPPYPAQECRNREMFGNNGKLYVSKRSANGVYRWVVASPKPRRRSPSKKRKSVKRSRRRSRSRSRSKKQSLKKSLEKYCLMEKVNISSMSRDQLIKKLYRYGVNWEKLTGKNQDMSMSRLRNEESTSSLRKMLRWYAKKECKILARDNLGEDGLFVEMFPQYRI
jgi:hypothetical protein